MLCIAMPLDLDKFFGRLLSLFSHFEKDDVILTFEENGYADLVVNNDNCVLAEKMFKHQSIQYALILGVPTTKTYKNPSVHFRAILNTNNIRFIPFAHNHMYAFDIEIENNFLILEKIAEFIVYFMHLLEENTSGYYKFVTPTETINQITFSNKNSKNLSITIGEKPKKIIILDDSNEETNIEISWILETEQEVWREVLIEIVKDYAKLEEET